MVDTRRYMTTDFQEIATDQQIGIRIVNLTCTLAIPCAILLLQTLDIPAIPDSLLHPIHDTRLIPGILQIPDIPQIIAIHLILDYHPTLDIHPIPDTHPIPDIHRIPDTRLILDIQLYQLQTRDIRHPFGQIHTIRADLFPTPATL